MAASPAETTDRCCVADARCRDYDHTRKHAALLADVSTPLCPDCLMFAERDVRTLTYDYIDLEQMLPTSLSQALDSQSQYGRRGEPPAPIRTSVEALQRTIWWATTTWAEVLIERHRLAEAPWADARRRVRDGYAVKWAVDVLTPRVRDLARVGAVELVDYPDVDEDAAVRHGAGSISTLTGAQGVLHLSWLRSKARATLGRTRRTTRVPGRCGCPNDGNYLYRDEPRYEKDPCPVYCGACPNRWTPEEYERYVGLMHAHPELADVEEIDPRAGRR